MTSEQLDNWKKELALTYGGTESDPLIALARKGLEREWITDRQPYDFGNYEVTVVGDDGPVVTHELFCNGHTWTGKRKILAWRHLPEPYKGWVQPLPEERCTSHDTPFWVCGCDDNPQPNA